MVVGTYQNDTENEFYQKLGTLHAWDGTDWQPLPAWARFYLELGTILASVHSPDSCMVVALAVPTRAYVSVLVAAGLILMRAVTSSGVSQISSYVATLQRLPVGTPVLVRLKQRKLRGIYQGWNQSFGKIRFGVQIEQENRTTHFIPETEAYGIQILEQDEMLLPLRQKGRSHKELAPLVRELLGESALGFSTETSLDCVLLGKQLAIKQEVQEQRLAVTSLQKTYHDGVLQDILRLKCFLSANSAYRSHVLSSSNRRVGVLAHTIIPYWVFFDGSLSYLRWHQGWKRSHSLIVLDRTEPSFDAARNQINHSFVQHRLDRNPKFDIPPVPAGVELMMFEVGR